jgi:hypothetical protein
VLRLSLSQEQWSGVGLSVVWCSFVPKRIIDQTLSSANIKLAGTWQSSGCGVRLRVT